jgi:2-polyprenyl-3-methyl-5-hydroxy-6-metoxy-1,4-benzoquinol methylase
MLNNRLDRSGIVALTDIDCDDIKPVYRMLENDQSEFLSKSSNFRSPDYLWPLKPLHTWSRVWEYPYVYHHVKNLINENPNNKNGNVKIVDFGSGVTFFPFSIARLGADVTCLDVDPICLNDIKKASECTDSESGKVDFKLIEGTTSPLPDNSVDIVYCISVLEHLDNYEEVIQDIHRILKTNGTFILTIDLDLKGNHDINAENYNRLRNILAEHFNLTIPEDSCHPTNMLTSKNSTYPTDNPSLFRRFAKHIKYNILLPMLGRKTKIDPPYHLAVWTGVFSAK